MKIKYDFHIHSALSPCADNDMTPVNIVAYAKFNGLDMIAVADHNAIENVETAIAAGKAYGVTVVPAVEVQTAEDIHVLCLFKTFEQPFAVIVNYIRSSADIYNHFASLIKL